MPIIRKGVGRHQPERDQPEEIAPKPAAGVMEPPPLQDPSLLAPALLASASLGTAPRGFGPAFGPKGYADLSAGVMASQALAEEVKNPERQPPEAGLPGLASLRGQGGSEESLEPSPRKAAGPVVALRAVILAPGPESGPLMRVLLFGPTPGRERHWKLPEALAPLDGGLERAAQALADEASGTHGAPMEPLGLFPPAGKGQPSYAWLALTGQVPGPTTNRRSAWVEARPEYQGGRIVLEGEGFSGIVSLCQDEVLRGRLKLAFRRVSESPLAPGHAEALLAALERLGTDINGDDRVFNLMPERFTLPRLQMVFEALSGERLLAPAFRRKIAARVAPTGDMARCGRHRPPRLYKYDHGWRERSGRPPLSPA